jgi:tetratricopeptide (TPR) repeat protein
MLEERTQNPQGGPAPEAGRPRAAARLIIAAAGLFAAARAWPEGGEIPAVIRLTDSPQSLAIGGSFAPIDRTAAGAFSYPGAYGLLRRASLSMSHTALFEGAAFDSAIAAVPTLRFGAFAVGASRLRSGEGQARDAAMNVTGSFFDEQTLLRAGYGNFLTPRIALGANLSYLRRSLAGVNNGFLSAGAGAHLSAFRALSIAASVDNAASRRHGGTDDRLPRVVRVSAASTLFRGTLLVGAESQFAGGLDIRGGVCYSPVPALGLFAGRSLRSSAAGIRLSAKDFQFNYSMGMHALGAMHQFSLSLPLGPNLEDRRRELAARMRNCAESAVAQGRYEDALGILEKSSRQEDLPIEAQALKDGLREVADAGVTSMEGPGERRGLLRKGIELYLRQEMELARSTLLQAEALNPRDASVKRLLALGGWRKKPVRLNLDPPEFSDVDPVQLKLFKCEQLFQQQQFDLALKECRDVLQINPREPLAYVRMGSIYYALGMKSEAVKAWSFAQDLAPEDREVQRAARFMRQERLPARYPGKEAKR